MRLTWDDLRLLHASRFFDFKLPVVFFETICQAARFTTNKPIICWVKEWQPFVVIDECQVRTCVFVGKLHELRCLELCFPCWKGFAY